MAIPDVEGSEIRVSPTGPNVYRPEVAATANGGFVVAYQAFLPTQTDPDGQGAVVFQRYAGDGSALGARQTAPSSLTGNHSDVVIDSTTSGGFVMAWSQGANRTAGGAPIFDLSMRVQVYDPQGVAVGNQFVLTRPPTLPTDGSRIAPSEVVTSGTTAFVFYANNNVSDNGRINLQRFDTTTGATIGTEIQLGATIGSVVDAERLSNDTVAVLTSRFNPLVGREELRIVTLSTLGAVLTNTVVDTPSFGGQGALERLSNDKLVATWVDVPRTGPPTATLRAQQFNANATAPDGAAITVATGGTYSDLDAVAHGNGSFSVFTTELFGTTDQDVIGRRFNANMSADGAAYRIHQVTNTGLQSSASLEALTDGNFIAAWEDYRAGNTAPNVIYAREFNPFRPPSITGSDRPETLDGTASGDLINGLGGDDTLNGGGGSDTLNGGLGNDRLDGGEGFDVALFAGSRLAVSIVRSGNSLYVRTSIDGLDIAINIEDIRAGDGSVRIARGDTVLQYIASYGDLIGAFGADAARALDHFRLAGAFEGRKVSFDGLAYLASYTDLASAFGFDAELAASHFITNGRTEGRTVTFAPWSYMAANIDVAIAYNGDFAAATEHFIRFGRSEGRSDAFNGLRFVASNPTLFDVRDGTSNTIAFLEDGIRFNVGDGSVRQLNESAAQLFIERGARLATDSFQWKQYLASNLDVAGAFGLSEFNSLTHYVSFGRFEGRNPDAFNELAYIASYADLISAFGTNRDAATDHYILYGANEGRRVQFDANAYLARYADLQAAFGTDTAAATLHYIQYGFAEGRTWA